MMTPEMLDHISKNKTEPVFGETVEEVLTRALSGIMTAVDQDEADPIAGDPHKRYNDARLAAIASKDISHRTEIRKILYSPSLPLALGSLQRLGHPFSNSWFLKLSSLNKFHGIHSGVSV